MAQDIVHPDYYKVFIKDANTGKWRVKLTQVFIPGKIRDYGITNWQVVLQLFRINGGKAGYYLADVYRKKYYYCGTQWDDVRSQLLKLGIGREHPQGM